ncbi:multicopper oxidase domain-containing protein [Streptomyces sp. NPDC048385]|uniref:multicopper oxidase domain-containing protein n=1 Tax=unclassified Streptomyces TaxID=2593676 RepID=UPI00342C6084
MFTRQAMRPLGKLGRRAVALIGAGAVMAGLAVVSGLPPSPVQQAQAAAATGPSSPTDETKVPHYFGPWPNWANSPLTLSKARVTITPTAMPVGNALAERLYATDYATPPGELGPVFVVLTGSPLPDGTLKSFQTWNQVKPGGSPSASEGGLFHAYVLRPAGAPDTYTVVADSGLQTVPKPTATAGEVATYNVPDVAVRAGDVIGFYGQGIPLDTGLASHTDTFMYPAGVDSSTSPPANVAPKQGGTVALGSTDYPLYPTQDRQYSFGAQVTPAGTGAEATATVDPQTGGIAGIDVTAPGHGYVAGATSVTVDGGTTAAAAEATVKSTGAVVDLKVGANGSGYGGFAVDITGGGGSGAAATASGGVDAVTIADGGSGYTMPTVDFDLPDDPNGTVAKGHVDPADLTADGSVTKVIVDDPGSGYGSAPGVAIHNGTLADPIPGATESKASSSLKLVGLTVDRIGSGYTGTPDVTISDPTGKGGTGAAAKAVTDTGAISAVKVTDPGAGYLSAGMKKFQDELPVTCDPKADGTGCPDVAQLQAPSTKPSEKFIPLAVPETVTTSGKPADEYVIGLVQYLTRFSSDLPPTLVRGYVQLSTDAVPGRKVPLYNELMDGTRQPLPYTGVTSPQWMGPLIAATKDRPVRIVFRDLLPKGADGDLFLPVDSTGMGSGMGPMAMPAPKNDGTVTDEVRNPGCTNDKAGCFPDNRATLHLHGGITPWISDGTPHQWITPAGETTDWPQGVSVQNVPDMVDGTGATLCAAKDDGCSTFYYTNQQSARLMFYHDHSYGITRLNVYAGEAAGYTITDDTEKSLIRGGTIPDAGDTVPLLVQDRTFVPDDAQLKDRKDADGKTISYGQDPTWNTKRWGTKGSFWYHHVYMPAQNPGDPSGMSAYGRWMYGPWFWPPSGTAKYGPIANPYYDPKCKLDVPSTWQYQTDPFCEPEQIPGTPNISMGMEQFNDTPIVNGVAYPKVTLQPKTYRMRLLNAANDRFFNFQWYTADPKQGDGTTEVALKPGELAAAQTDPTVSPTPVDANNDLAGPDWIQIANEGGFLPAPAVIDGQQPTTWITDPTRFDVGNVDKHSLALAPAERADVLVDFSKFAGKTLILYNDAPAAYPARIPSYDYYTGAPDLSPAGAPKILPGYGPNTRTVMQVTIADTAPAPAFDLAKLRAAFRHHADGSGVFESGQNPAIVGQAAYNSAYGTTFAASSNCNVANTSVNTCDGLVRVNDTSAFGFNTLKSPNTKMSMPLQPKAIHDEMNATAFDDFGRMQANLGVEAQPPTPGAQNVTLYPYVNPQTELIDGTDLPKGDVKVTPISTNADGTQIWRFTHNGVDTHPIHFHLYDVQVLNRVTWDNIVIRPDANELGWKDTVRMSPLEDTIVALRPVVPTVPFEVPNSIRPLDPAMPLGDTSMFNNIDPQGNPTAAITNKLVNFGWEYVIHCHILSHEEMDMMRPASLALPPLKASGLSSDVVGTGTSARIRLTWQDNSVNETSFVVQRSSDGTTWADVGTVASPLDQPNIHEARSFVDPTASTATPYLYRVVALNTVGYGSEFPSMTVKSVSDPLGLNGPLPPTGLSAALRSGKRVGLTWRDNSTNESGFVIERSTDNGVTFKQVGKVPARTKTGRVTFVDGTVGLGSAYQYRVSATNVAGRRMTRPLTVQVSVRSPR